MSNREVSYPLPALLLEGGTAGLLACTAAGQYARTQPSLSLALHTNVTVSNLSRDILFSTFVQVSFYFLGKKTGGHGPPPRPLPLLWHCAYGCTVNKRCLRAGACPSLFSWTKETPKRSLPEKEERLRR